ncbi:hypothetical protein [Sodalis-like endosymbiont of Proechinophthirus fluctus]|uniref:hypothetical protein n=1 Tax=Sodalis-like endosymbiont of Proechinophthirus fluctus TaxID=1462730 RepID=UPI003F74CED5
MEQDIKDPGTIQFLLKLFHKEQWCFALDSIKHNYADIISWQTQAPWSGRYCSSAAAISSIWMTVIAILSASNFPTPVPT